MSLDIKQLADLMDVKEKQILKWIKDKKLPVSTLKEEYQFNKPEVDEWVIKNSIKVPKTFFSAAIKPSSAIVLSDIISSSGIFYGIKGETVEDVLRDSLSRLQLPSSLSLETVITSFIEREKMMSTAVGKGVSIPHSRVPIVSCEADERIAVCFLENPINYEAIDNLPVHTLFVILSSNPKRHLEMLSKISFLLQQDDFIKLLENKVIKEILIDYIKDKEKEIKV